MNRVIIALVLVCGILGYSFVAVFVTKNQNEKLYVLLDGIEENVEIQNAEKAYKFATKLDETWNEYEEDMAFIIRDDRLHTLSQTISKIRPYIVDSNDEISAEIQNVRSQLEFIYKSEIPFWYNII